MPTSDATKYTPLNQDQIAIILSETRDDVKEIKQALGPLKDWQNRIQGGMNLMRVILAIAIAAASYALFQWDSTRSAVIKLQDKQDQQDSANTVNSNQLSLLKSQADSNATELQKHQEQIKRIPDLESRLTSDETSGILHKGK